MIRIKQFLFSFFMVCIFSGPVFAAGSCYSSREYEAEQGLKIHSEMMVIGLNCSHMAPDVFVRYQHFTKQNAVIFGDYETILINFYRDIGLSNPERKLHDLRTALANSISGEAAKSRPDLFCRKNIPRIKRVMAMNSDEIRRWASTIYPGQKLSYPLCMN